ncbi:thioredoxin family protein [Fulvivirga maritima]|uniref:thioredoxin family protein n=1 Tax=Fulvivirga maritima TaxID=2904247 RepID=UPI001F249659|nr:thioredoxin family protein [Fulvivirga maritima]UII25745.1 thioredoxin family protein [Fulvivirga maritima]
MSDFSQLIYRKTPVLVDFHASWSESCKKVNPVLERVKSELGDRLKILKVDVDRNPSTVKTYDIWRVPTLVLIWRGQRLWKHHGIITTGPLLEQMKRFFSKNILKG